MYRLAFFIMFIPLFSGCGLEEILTDSTYPTTITDGEASLGLKSALEKGITKGTQELSQMDGYFKNPVIKIPFPPEAQKIANTLRDIGLGSLVDDVELSINRAAEDAAAKAVPVFVDAIKGMTISDAMGILFGGDQAATDYLKQKTSDKLTAEFKPIIETSLDKVNATKFWEDVITTYNKIPLVKDMNPDLVDYVNGKALDGLFHVVGQEEKKIRDNPIERTTAILQKVFNYYDKNK